MMVTLPPDYRPSEDEDFMNAMQVEYFRQKLLRWRADLLREADGTLASLPAEYLRVESPSAEVQGHGEKRVPGGKRAAGCNSRLRALSNSTRMRWNGRICSVSRRWGGKRAW